MATQTQETSRTPELTIIYRVAAIPLIASSLNTINETLINNAYTRQPYTTAKGLSLSALSYTEPIQKRLAPLIVRADGYANMGLDAVESRYPYPFKIRPEDIVKDLKARSDYAKDVANKTLDEKVRSPALNVAQGIDQRFAPIVDYFAVAVNKFQGSDGNGTVEHAPDAKYQYQRAFVLSKELSDQLRTYSTEQINQLKEHNALVKRASETAHDISTLASTSYGTAQTKVHQLSDTMLAELQKIQATTAALPAHLQASFHDISTHLSSTIHDLSAIITSPDPLQEKVHKLRDTVQERVNPLLEAATARVHDILGAVTGRAGEKEAQAEGTAKGVARNGSAALSNGNGHGRK
ncbi:uncharacterized protein LAESUDRAFT_699384 [Laetiporus sulphureus 93-53]|uniref:Lipid droplet-associated perilipin protein n=1 Tax=Laetiporus sulphureus 93-53 TaxID=1314785 RepID=A0A165EGS1_9APHY|nr:uncharacterized protein LAESUDRAFT_699384 [Laetiporus sulphureus 93-53]KZT07021.1 hypothetical protein LAESUDRAFT_699384 [Laetiporus sulphureus 93-53]